MLIPRHVFAISKVCDSESSRYALGGVRIEREPNGQPIAIATDGRRLVMTTWSDTDADEYPALDATPTGDEIECMIPAKQWNEAGKLAPRKSLKSILTKVALCERSINGTVKLVGSDIETTRSIEPRQLEGKFPKWRDVFPEYAIRNPKDDAKDPALANTAVRITLDHKFLAELCAVVHSTSGADPAEARGIDLIVPLDTGGAVVLESQSEHGQTVGILMPLSRDEKTPSAMIRPPVASPPKAIEAPEPKALPAPEPDPDDHEDGPKVYLAIVGREVSQVPSYFGFGAAEQQRGTLDNGSHAIIATIRKNHATWQAQRLGSGLYGCTMHETRMSLSKWMSEWGYVDSKCENARPESATVEGKVVSTSEAPSAGASMAAAIGRQIDRYNDRARESVQETPSAPTGPEIDW